MLRPATMGDAELLHCWANDAETRAASFTTDLISWESHLAWLGSVLADTERRLWIGVDGGRSIGQVRLDRAGKEEVISLALAPSARGRGLATPLILAACEEASGPVLAEIQSDNTRSRRAFEAAGFVEVERAEDRVVMLRPAH